MTKRIWIGSACLVAFGILLGVGIDRGWRQGLIPTASAQQGRNPLPTMESLPGEVAQLKALLPSNSHIMMDVQFHWTSLWFAGRNRNWALAKFYFDESRSHMIWLIRKSPVVRGQQDIFDGIDTSSLADVKSAIEKKDSLLFAAAYKTMLESCYSCHKSVGRPYLKPMIPRTPVQSVMNVDPNATWPQ